MLKINTINQSSFKEFFKEFLSNPSEYGNFVSDIKPNPKRPVSKIDKKTIEASNIVTVEVDRLRKAMEDQGIIKTASLFSFKPRIIVGPSKKWMDDNKYYKAIDNQGVTVRVYDFPNACMDSKIVNALQAIKSKLGSPTSPFEVVSIDKVLEDISLRDQINNAASQSSKSSSLDVFYNTLKADLWLELSLTTSSPDKGITTVFEGSLTAHDPYSMTEAIPGKPILKETKGSDMVSLTKDLINGVMNEFTPKVLEHFQKVQKSGIQGKIVYTILEEGLDDNFFTEVTFKDVDMPLAQAIDKIQKQTKQFPKVPENQTNTKTLQDYNASIFFEYEDEDMGTMEKNTFLRVANQIAVGLKKLGYITEVESTGMGRAEIKIIGKKE